ncbi:MAG: type II toxin-antitoxin system Phd/YefM family antitoxin [Clostridiales bacterium]|nr:type II toxin-antitoxin system Phd/YefM family antitoxin [Clostridiales bacterium]
MTNTNITQARSNLFKLADQIIKFNDVVNITTKDGNVVMMSEEDYNSIMETLYLYSIPGMRESILEGAKTPTEDCRVFNWREELK